MTFKEKEFRKLHFVIMVIEASAKKQNIESREMYRRLKAQDLINLRLLCHYETLHTQSLDWVVDDTIETLLNWEKEEKEASK